MKLAKTLTLSELISTVSPTTTIPSIFKVFSGLRLPFLPFSPWSESRMTLLWLLRKFDCFDYRCCRCCGNPIRTQSHVSVCGGLSSRLLSDPHLPILPADQPILPFPVEKVLMASLAQSPQAQRVTINSLSRRILDCVTTVYGDQHAPVT